VMRHGAQFLPSSVLSRGACANFETAVPGFFLAVPTYCISEKAAAVILSQSTGGTGLLGGVVNTVGTTVDSILPKPNGRR
jgi:hypothetical protein